MLNGFLIRYGTYLFSNANQKVQLGYFVTRLLDPDWSKATPNFVMMQVLSSDINQTLKHQSDYDLRIKSANQRLNLSDWMTGQTCRGRITTAQKLKKKEREGYLFTFLEGRHHRSCIVSCDPDITHHYSK